MYKKVYLEITNRCNLNCPFCIKNTRPLKNLNMEEFSYILNQLKPYTKYLYFHILGEPLLHPEVNEFIDKGSQDFNINITTNGYLIKKIQNNHNIRQINISLHSFDPSYKIPLEEYLNNIVTVINNLKENTYFSLRFWVNNKYNEKIISILSKAFAKKIELKNGFKICDNVFISINKEFKWPSLENDYNTKKGTCYALKDHIGILVNGDIVPCCLDSKGIMKLGNIFHNTLEEVIKSNKYEAMLKGFKNNQKIEQLCQKCNFLNQ